MRRFKFATASIVLSGAVAGSLVVPVSGALAARAGVDTRGSTAQRVDDPVATVNWGACTSARLKSAGAECAMLAVPLDYDHPGVSTVKLALSRIKHTVPDDQYQGIMLVNPGGPGGSGLGLSILGGFVPNNVGKAYDWIGFDPRGVGSSVPALTCDKNYFSGNRPGYVPYTRSLERFWLRKAKGYAKACAANGPILEHMKTVDVVRDMDRIRDALQVHQINFYGFSYGTYLGQVFASMYPERVRRMVLDSNVDPTRVWYPANLDQDIAFERNMKIWWAWVAKYDSVYHLGKTERAVERAWYAEKARLRKHPAGGVVGPSEWSDIFLAAGYYQVTWTDLGSLWANWVKNHKPAPVVAAYQDADSPGDDNGYAVYDAVQCTDVQWPQKWSTWRRDNWWVFRKAPFETWANAWYNAPCLYWPAKAGVPVTVDGRQAPGILLIGETLDAATPFSGSLEVRRRFPAASLIGLPGGTSHAVSLFGNACVDDQIAHYLGDGTLPERKSGDRPDTTCKPAPLPVPPATAKAATGSGTAAALVRAAVRLT